MKQQVLEILEKVKSGELGVLTAHNNIMKVLGIGFYIGAKVKITCCTHGHEYDKDEIVTVIEPSNGTNYWLCVNDKGVERYVWEHEGEVL